jgi:recombination protein RecA
LLLDYAIANKRGGGYPAGRIIEIAGLPSTGKSHLAYEAARTVQEAGGLVIYVDTENATPVEKLGDMGLDVTKRFVYIDTHTTEEVFSVIDSIIQKSKSLSDKGLPILAIWDSVAGTSPKAELDAAYDANSMMLQARVLSKGFRKITGLLGQTGVTLMCINQLRMKMSANPYSDPYCVEPNTTVVNVRAKQGTKMYELLKQLEENKGEK